MVAFATLFLALVTGWQTIELTASDDVSAIEIQLDGQTVDRLDRPPWKLAIDLGDDLRPRRLEAIALDARGREVDRAEQILNFPRPEAEANLSVDFDADGATARVQWEATSGAEPTSWIVLLDGREIEVDDLRSFRISGLDRSGVHVLSVEIEGLGITTEAATLGLSFGDETTSEVTSIVVEPTGRSVEASDVRSRLRAGPRPVAVTQFEKGEADVVLVIDPSLFHELDRLVKQWQRVYRPGSARRDQVTGRSPLTLEKDLFVRFVWPWPAAREGRRLAYEVFPASSRFSRDEGTPLELFLGIPKEGLVDEPPRLADAVATAGVEAAMGKSRRGVVLLLGPSPVDGSDFTPTQVRRLLSSLGVAFEVWSTDPQAKHRTTEWGEIVDSSTVLGMDKQFQRFQKRLDRQRVAWIDGFVLPDELTISGGSKFVVAGHSRVDDFRGSEELVPRLPRDADRDSVKPETKLGPPGPP